MGAYAIILRIGTTELLAEGSEVGTMPGSWRKKPGHRSAVVSCVSCDLGGTLWHEGGVAMDAFHWKSAYGKLKKISGRDVIINGSVRQVLRRVV